MPPPELVVFFDAVPRFWLLIAFWYCVVHCELSGFYDINWVLVELTPPFVESLLVPLSFGAGNLRKSTISWQVMKFSLSSSKIIGCEPKISFLSLMYRSLLRGLISPLNYVRPGSKGAKLYPSTHSNSCNGSPFPPFAFFSAQNM